MSIDDKLERIIEDIKSSEAKNSNYLKELEKELKDRKAKDCEKLLRYVDPGEAGRILEVIKKLSECLNYTDLGYKGEDYPEAHIDLSPQQFKMILHISRLKGDVSGMLETVSYLGFSLKKHRGKRYINSDEDKYLFTGLMKEGFSDEKKIVLKSLKDMLGYSFCKTQEECQKLTKVSGMEGDVLGAVCLLASEDCKINQKTGLTKKYLKALECLASELESMNGGNYSYLYKKVKPEFFKEYFSSLSLEKKKLALEKILESDHYDKEVVEWLEQNYYGLLREVGFKD